MVVHVVLELQSAELDVGLVGKMGRVLESGYDYPNLDPVHLTIKPSEDPVQIDCGCTDEHESAHNEGPGVCAMRRASLGDVKGAHEATYDGWNWACS